MTERIETDLWMRFDIHANAAIDLSNKAIELERGRGDNTETCAVTDSLVMAAKIRSELAWAASPNRDRR